MADVFSIDQNYPTSNALLVPGPNQASYTVFIYKYADWINGNKDTLYSLAQSNVNSDGTWQGVFDSYSQTYFPITLPVVESDGSPVGPYTVVIINSTTTIVLGLQVIAPTPTNSNVVTSLNGLVNDIVLTSTGSTISIIPTGQTIDLEVIGGGGGGGVTSLNTLTGALSIVAGSNVTITPSGSSLILSSTGNVLSVFGRTGVVTAQSGDYSFPQISGLLDISQISATGIASSTTYLRGDGSWATVVGGVTSVFGRSGAVTAQTGDYSFSQISGSITTAQEPSTTVNSVTNDTNVTGSISAQDLTLGWTGTLAVSRGGTGTASPSLVAGTGITVTGSWPNQTITASGSGTVTDTSGSLTANAVVIGNGGSDIKTLASLGTSGQILTSNGASSAPSFQNAPSGFTAGGDLSGTSTSQEVIGILSKAIDGTTPTDGEILQYSNSTGKWELVVDRPIFPVSAVAGKPSAGQLVCIYTAAVSMTFPGNFASPNSYGSVGTNPTATAAYQIYKNGSLIGGVSVSTSGVFSFTTSGGSSFNLNAGDRLTIVAPGTQDSTMSDVGITLVGTRTATVPAVLSQGIFLWRGVYNGATTYSINDVVSYIGGIFICILGTTGNAPTNTTYWNLMAGYEWNNRGAYSGSTAYNPNDIVALSGATYLCILATTGNSPPNATYWQLVASAGASSSAGAIQQESYVYAIDAGIANAFSVTLSPAPVVIDGSVVVFRAANATTGASTLTLPGDTGATGGTAQSFVKQGGTALTTGDIAANQVVMAVWDNTHSKWEAVGAGGGGDVTAKYLIGATDSTLTNAIVWPGITTSPDIPPVTRNAMDDEFDGASLNSPNNIWTWTNQGSSTEIQGNSYAIISCTTNGSTLTPRFIGQSLPSAPYGFTIKIGFHCLSNYGLGGFIIYESSSSKGIVYGWEYSGGYNLELYSFPSGNIPFNIGALASPWIGQGYLRFTRSGTTLNFYYSINGITYDLLYSESITTHFTTAPDTIGIGLIPYSQTTTIDVDFFRRTT